MKAVLIDPFVQICTDIDLPKNAYREIRELIPCTSAGTFYPAIINVPGYDGRFICWVDDLGFLADEVAPLWEIAGYTTPLSGRGILRGLDNDEGDHQDIPLSAEEVAQLVTWRDDIEFVGMVTTTTEGEMHPTLGMPMTRIETVCVFEPKEKNDGK